MCLTLPSKGPCHPNSRVLRFWTEVIARWYANDKLQTSNGILKTLNQKLGAAAWIRQGCSRQSVRHSYAEQVRFQSGFVIFIFLSLIFGRFTFFDQIHTTGIDIKQSPTARAVITIGKDMVFRDYAQGAYRMRGIGKGQCIHLYLVPEVISLVSQTLQSCSAETGWCILVQM